MLLEKKTAIVTGGGQGIGRAIALRFAEEGAAIAVCDIDESTGSETVEKAKSLGRQSEFYKVDVGSLSEVEQVVMKILDNFKSIDILVNNAGITRDNVLLRMKDEDWDTVIRVNLKGTFNFTKAVYKPMMKQRGGRIINIASIIGLIGNFGQGNYAASKAGIIGFTKSIAKELGARGINVNAVAPGFIATAMTEKIPEDTKKAMLEAVPLGKFGAPDDIADVVLFLASHLSRYITGSVINVSGGFVM